VPPHLIARHPPDSETLDWAASGALDRLGFATPGEIAAFWDMVTPAEAKAWVDRARGAGEVIDIEVIGADGRPRRAVARPNVLSDAEAAPEPPRIARILSPFDPLLRDRQRAERLFGFRFRIEVFVPAARRQWGYYVCPVLEGDRLIGRIDLRADRDADLLRVTAFWPEVDAPMGRLRLARLERALERTRRLAGVGSVDLAPGWLREPQRQ